MKRLLLIVGCLLLLISKQGWSQTNDEPRIKSLPAKSQDFIHSHFSQLTIAHVSIDKDWIWVDEYEVLFTDGSEISFDHKGEWSEVKLKDSVFPIKLLPSAISKYLRTTYPQQKVYQVEREKNKYSIKLDTGMEISFDKKGNVEKIDR